MGRNGLVMHVKYAGRASSSVDKHPVSFLYHHLSRELT